MISEFLVIELKVDLGNYQEEMKKREKEGQQGAEHLERKTSCVGVTSGRKLKRVSD